MSSDVELGAMSRSLRLRIKQASDARARECSVPLTALVYDLKATVADLYMAQGKNIRLMYVHLPWCGSAGFQVCWNACCAVNSDRHEKAWEKEEEDSTAKLS